MSKKSRRRNKRLLAMLALAGGAAMMGRGKGTAQDKINKMKECGITIAKSPAEIGKTLLNKLSN